MFLLAVGFSIGFFASVIILSLINFAHIAIDISAITNTIIALATVIATIIHHDSVKKQRKDRVWEINKSTLLELDESLVQAIAATELSLDPEQAPKVDHKTQGNVWDILRKRMDLAINVYGSLMSADLIKAISEARTQDQKIYNEVFNEDLDTVEAHERSLENMQILHVKLQSFIAEMSGIKNLA